MSCNVRSHVSDILPGHKPATLKILFIEEMLEIQIWAIGMGGERIFYT